MCAKLNVEPTASLVDDLVRITVSGLTQLQSVTVAAFVADGGMTFQSYGHYLSDDTGHVHLQTAPSIGGTYDGVEPMGLLWSMKPVPGQRKGLRLMKKDVTEPYTVDVYLLRGLVDVRGKDDLRNYEILDRRQMLRFYQSPDVSAVPVKEGCLRGMLFLPPGPGPFPGVIDMFGTAGGLTKHRAALLASRGFAALALAYFNHDDLPPSIELHLEYFRDAADWLHDHPRVLKTGVGAIGVSKGAAMAMEMAILNDKVKAVVAINPYCCHCIGVHYYEGRMQPVVNCGADDLYETDEGVVYERGFRYNEANEEAMIQVERATKSNFLFIVGEDDATCERKQVDVLVDRLRRRRESSAAGDDDDDAEVVSGRDPGFQVLSYPGAGHLIEPPFTPHFRSCYSKFIGSVCLYGGEAKAHSKAQEDSWRQTLRFFRNNLCQSVTESKRECPPINSKL